MMQPSPHLEYQQKEPIILPRQVTAGKRLVVLAEANEGPVFKPILVHNETLAKEMFQSGPLVDRFLDIVEQTDNRDIYLMRILPHTISLAFDYLQPYSFDLLYADDFDFGAFMENAWAFIEFAKSKREKGQLIHGIFELMDFNNISELKPVFQYINQLTFENLTDQQEDGKYMSVVVNQFKNKSAGAIYAGMLNELEPEISPVNKPIANVELKKEFTKEDLLTLREAGIVCFKDSYHKGVVCTSSSAAVSTPGSVHKHISNFRIVQYLISEITENVQGFIGGTNIRFYEDKIKMIIDQILEAYQELGRIRNAQYQIRSNNLRGHVFIDLDVVPIFSIDHITAHSQVRIYK